MSWTNISEQEAQQHQLYGLKGWLLAIFVLYVLGVIAGLGSIFGGFGAAEQEMMFGIYADDARNMMLIETLLGVPFIVLALMKHKLMPKVAIACLWLAFAVNLYTQMTWAVWMQNVTLAIMAAVYGLLTWYFIASKRVNVTYLHRLPAGRQAAPAAA